MKKFILVLFVCIITVNAQIDTSDVLSDEILRYLEDISSEQEDSEIYDLIEQLLNNPVNLNGANFDMLMAIPFMDVKTASAILVYRESNEKFLSVNELNSIEEIDHETFLRIRPFLYIGSDTEADISEFPGTAAKFLEVEFRSRMLSDVQNRAGFSDGKFSGSKIKSYNRLKLNSKDYLRAGGLIEKDAGESSYSDFSSFHIYSEKLLLDKIILGDYLVEFGEGLAIWSPYAFSKGAAAVKSVGRNSRDITPYTSSDENQFLRGAAGSYSISDFSITAFYSSNSIDANLDTVDQTIISLPIDGYHRTENEIKKKDNIKEKIYGGILKYSTGKNFSIGILHYRNNFEYSLLKNNIYDPAGDQFNFSSVSYRILFGSVYLSGESSFNGISVANIINAQFSVSKNFAFVTSVRSYPKNYWNIHSAGFGEKSGTQNELGIYTGLRWRTEFGLFNFYFDQFKFPFASYSNPLPASGYETLGEFSTRPLKKSLLTLRYTHENKEVSINNGEIEFITYQLRRKFRLGFSYEFDKHIRYRTRVEYMHYFLDHNNYNEEGYLFFNDIRFKKGVLTLYGRVSLFQTDSYNSRIYEFENDLPGVMRNMALFGNGTRWYIIAKFEAFQNFFISLKYAETLKFGERSISSGYSEIQGNLDNNLSIQIDFNY